MDMDPGKLAVMTSVRRAMPRNPAWHRDELILALDLYFRVSPARINQNHPEVRSLSKTLNALPIHSDRPDAARFRNANGVYMKLCNFLRFDPTYKGTGLRAGGALEGDVWKEFAPDRAKLMETATAIRARTAQMSPQELISVPEDGEDEFPEGRVLFRAHRSRERNRALVLRAKQLALKKYGRLACEICGFDFVARYGHLGKGYIECHHTVPISHLAPEARTRVADVALLCSNCHRMVHRRRPWLELGQLSTLLQQPGKVE
jgi:5-methylcytosine-specific restriction protein A